MNGTECMTILPDKKIQIEYGPVSMVIQVKKNGIPKPELGSLALHYIQTLLSDLGKTLPRLKKKSPDLHPCNFPPIAQKMVSAVCFSGSNDLTAMAAVAGSVADLTADYLFNYADYVIVNNGGDIALRIKREHMFTLGIQSGLSARGSMQSLRISGMQGIGGIATSGLGGRSFTKGVADAVTVLAESSAQADALATHLANASSIHSPHVLMVNAGRLDPDSDIASDMVTYRVGVLNSVEIKLAASYLLKEAKRLYREKKFIQMYANIQGHLFSYPLKQSQKAAG